MASQIAHIIYSDKLFRKIDAGDISADLSRSLQYPTGKIDRDEFLLGSTFPDVRRIDSNIRRKDTHMYFPKIDLDFSGLTSFQAGWKFHLWCDMRREEILNKYRFYELENTADFYGHSSKLLEDELVYDGYNNWEKVSLYFKNPPFFSFMKNVSEDAYRLWYAILAKYMERKPDNAAMSVFLSKQANLGDKIDAIITSVDKIRNNKKAIEIINKIKVEII